MAECKVLVVDDEPQIHTFIRISLTAEGFIYRGARSVRAAIEMFRDDPPHLVVLDLGLPDGDGMVLLEWLRSQGRTPVLILTARNEEDEKIRLLEAGANDYLSKPFGIRELIVRIKVLVRDLVSDVQLDDVMVAGSLRARISSHQLWLNGEEVALTKKEFSMMALLMRNPGRLVAQEILLEEIWGKTHVEDTHYLRILVSQLRKKLNDNAEKPQLIKTEAGIGYRLIAGIES